MPTYTTSPTETLRLGDVVVLRGVLHEIQECCPGNYKIVPLDAQPQLKVLCVSCESLYNITELVRQEFAKLAPKKSPKFAVGQVWEGPNGHRMRIDKISADQIAVHIVHSPDGECQYEWTKWELDGSGLFAGRKDDNLSLTKLIADAPAPEKEPAKDEVTLVLTREEAQFLRQVTGKFVRGEGPARKFNRSIFEKLEELGFCSIKGYPISSTGGIWCDEVKEPLFRLNEVWRTEKKYLVRVIKVNPGGSGFVRTIHNPKDAGKVYDSEQRIAVYANGIVTSSNDKLVEKISD